MFYAACHLQSWLFFPFSFSSVIIIELGNKANAMDRKTTRARMFWKRDTQGNTTRWRRSTYKQVSEECSNWRARRRTCQPTPRWLTCQPGLEEGDVSASSEEEVVPFGVTLS
jgi:hypothetical protein